MRVSDPSIQRVSSAYDAPDLGQATGPEYFADSAAFGPFQRVKSYFDDKTYWEGGVWRPTEYSWQLARLLRFIDLTDRSVLDLGCGAGNLALLAAARGARAYASDIMPDAVTETARNAEFLGLPVQVELSDGLEYWIAKRRKFDVIVCNPPCVDELETIVGPSIDPCSNSFLIKDLLNTYKEALSDSGCLLFVVSGEKNMTWAEYTLQHKFPKLNAYIANREVCFQAVPDERFERLCESGLIKRRSAKAVWNAYYFAIFHF